MRKTLLFLCLFITNVAIAQIKDDFSDGNFSVNPNWVGNTANFTVNTDFKLQSAGGTTGTQNIYLSTQSSLASAAVWEFFFQLNFNPTADNQLRVYLVSNQADLSGSLQGYFFQVGETGNADGLHLYRQNGTTTTKILTGLPKTWASTSVTSARIKVIRDIDGKWQLYSDVAGGSNFNFEGEVTDNTYTVSSSFGVNCRYSTGSRSSQYFFDDFNVSALASDATAPTLLNAKVINSKTLELTYSEPVTAATAQALSNYIVGGVNPTTASFGALGNIITLIFANDFASGPSTITANNIADAKGNVAVALSKSFLYIKPYTAKKGDVVINEIFADPSPVVGLPDKEFIELYNTTNEYIIITGWKLKDGAASGTPATLAADTLAPNEYRILCANADVALYKPFGKTMGLSGWPSLNNDTDDLKLMLPDVDNTVIDQVLYMDSWYGDEVKKQGGYTLELINSTSSCTGAANWKASIATIGGTPGTQNSVFQAQPDLTAPKLLSATVINATTVQLYFDRAIDAGTLTTLANFNVNNGVGNPSGASVAFDSKSVTLTFGAAFTRGQENTITVNNLTSCAGTVVDPNANSATIFLAKEAKAGDILISEILFNPKTEGNDFVEIYNNADYTIDLKDLTISNPSANGAAGTQRAITATSIFIQPKQYWVLTADPAKVSNIYNVVYPDQIISISSMPAFNNGDGAVKIWKGAEAIDEFTYNEKMHHTLLKEVKGVSLERVSFAKPANEKGNMQSAAASAGFATPTGANSQGENSNLKNSFKVTNKTFSPDNDGFEDVLNIDYQFKENGNLATVNVYTDRGVLVKKLVRNITLSTQGTLTWDGLSDGGQLCKVGIYVVTAEIFNLNGTKDSFKQSCVLAAKLN